MLRCHFSVWRYTVRLAMCTDSGSFEAPRLTISQLEFSDGTDVELNKNDVMVIVGPNNAGKTAALRSIREKLTSSATKSPVVQNMQVMREGSASDLRQWLDEWAVRQGDSSVDNPVYLALGSAVHVNHAQMEWQRTDSQIGPLVRWFCHLLSADERLQISNPAPSIALARENPAHPIHFLQRDDKLEQRLSSKFRKAFGVDLILHRNAGNQVPLHVGDRPLFEVGEDRVSLEYVKKLEKLPTLQS
jgi:hypothetical protein